MQVRCPYCHNPAKLVGGDVIYPHRPDLFAKKFWQCLPCDAYVGTHKGSKDHQPLGRLANAELRAAKQRAHAAFDPIWKSGAMSRSEAYGALARLLGIEKKRCHIGWFDVERCSKVVDVVKEIRG